MYARAVAQIAKEQEEQGERIDQADSVAGAKSFPSSRGASEVFSDSIEKLKGIDGFTSLAQYEAMFALRRNMNDHTALQTAEDEGHMEDEEGARNARLIRRSDYSVSFSCFLRASLEKPGS